jgi:anti-anti-sigma regulatory factor
MYEWSFDQSFRLIVTRDAGIARMAFVGYLDAVTAKNLEQRAQLPSLPDSEVVLDLTELDAIDTAGAREIRRIESLYVDCEVCGARPDVLELLELMPRSA